MVQLKEKLLRWVEFMKEQMHSVNGIELYSLTNSALKSFCLSLYIKAGSIFEKESENGISHLFEHIVFRNLKNKYENFYELLALHGLDVQGCTYKEFIHFSITGPYYEFDFATEIFCELFAEIKLTKDELNKEKKRIKAEIREKDERNTIDYYFNKLVWAGSEAEKSILGYCKIIDSISIKKLNVFRDECFSKGNFFIYATGNVSEKEIDELKKRVEKLNFEQNKAIRTNTVTVNENFFNRECTLNIRNDYWHYIKIGFDIDCTEYSGCVTDLLYAVLFKGDKALLHNYLSEDNPIIYSYESTLEQYDNVGNINFKFEVEKDRIEAALKIIAKLLNAIKCGKFNFDVNLKAEICNTEMESDRPEDLNWSMAYYNHILKTDKLDYSDEYYGRFKNITKEDIMQAANGIFKVSNMTVAIKGNRNKIKINEIQKILKMLDERA